MPLIIDLKPNERIIVGNALITNDQANARIHIEGEAPILREKKIMRESEANTPCKRVFFVVQLMYLCGAPERLYDVYFSLVREIQQAAPSTTFFFSRISEGIMNGEYYQALNEALNLMEHEREILETVYN